MTGGMTFFPNLYGLGTDSVKNFEVCVMESLTHSMGSLCEDMTKSDRF